MEEDHFHTEEREKARGPHKILLVDDEQTILRLLSSFLITRGFSVDCASNMEAALSAINDATYSLVISDLSLTGNRDAQGLEILKYVRRHNPATRVIILTGYGTVEIEAEAHRCGVDFFLYKPVDLDDLLKLVTDVCGSRPS